MHPAISSKSKKIDRETKAAGNKPGTRASVILTQVADDFTKMLARILGNQLISVVLFGSIARGEARKKSDVDLLIVVKAPTETDLIWMREQITELCLDFEAQPEALALMKQGFPAVIRQIVYSEAEALRTHLFYLDLVVDGRILYDRDGFFAAKLARVRRRMARLGTRREYLSRRRWVWQLKPGMKPGERVEL